jgi:hypothetical protein
MPLVNYARTNRPVFDIDLDASPYDRWQDVGRRNKAKLGRFLREIEDLAKDGMMDWIDQPSAWVPAFIRSTAKRLIGPLLECAGRVGGRLGSLMARSFGEDYQAEIRGLAHASGLPESKLFLANLTYDLTVASDWWLQAKRRFFGACSSFSVSVAGHPVLVRNMDWALPESTGRMTVMTRFHKGSSDYINIAPIGCVGVLSAMRVGGWAVTLNQAPPAGLPRFPQWPAMHRLRNACDVSLMFPQLVRRIAEYQTLTPFFAHVVGTEPDQQIVIEGAAGGFRRRRAKRGKPLIQTNHFIHDAHRHHNGEEWQGRDCDICDRYAALQQRLRTKPKDFADAFSRIRGRPVTHSGTMNQMALRPADGKAIVRVRH